MQSIFQSYSRRQFLTTAAGASGAFLLHPLFARQTEDIDPRIAAIVAKTIGIDTHNHIDVPLNAPELPGPAIDLAGELKNSGLTAVCMTFAVDYQKLVNPGDAYNRFVSGLDAMDKALKDNKIKRAFNLSDLKIARQKHHPTVIQSVEGAHFLEGKLDRLAGAYERGLRHLGLLHDNDASVPLGDIYTKTPQWGGLTAFGADVIRECNRQGILVDLAHASNATIDAALKVATKPVLISHTGLDTQPGQNERMAQMMKPRLISKEQSKIVADAGGVIGVWTHLAETPIEFAANVRALVEIIGADHVAIGTDTKLTPAYRSPNAPNRGAGGQAQQGVRAGERTNFAWADQKTGFYYTVVEALLKAGFNEQEIGKIGGGNYCRLFDAATA
ncbi:membrane dipeptidase [Dyadobacter sp. SG02]|uniref:dipeptidase n=1 Tax=Dyadobacter sp. SG02 TaxID=1855291 RepID=UPI0008C36C24|nr:membrane dipeptidase [Dyadobacter sp. SG02]SEJ66807.1 membrane dipeptidase [Dyadobacter sp. SG02]